MKTRFFIPVSAMKTQTRLTASNFFQWSIKLLLLPMVVTGHRSLDWIALMSVNNALSLIGLILSSSSSSSSDKLPSLSPCSSLLLPLLFSSSLPDSLSLLFVVGGRFLAALDASCFLGGSSSSSLSLFLLFLLLFLLVFLLVFLLLLLCFLGVCSLSSSSSSLNLLLSVLSLSSRLFLVFLLVVALLFDCFLCVIS